MYLLISFISWL